MLLHDWQDAMADDADKYGSVLAALRCDRSDVAATREICVPLLLDPLAHSPPRGKGRSLVMRLVAAFITAGATFQVHLQKKKASGTTPYPGRALASAPSKGRLK